MAPACQIMSRQRWPRLLNHHNTPACAWSETTTSIGASELAKSLGNSLLAIKAVGEKSTETKLYTIDTDFLNKNQERSLTHDDHFDPDGFPNRFRIDSGSTQMETSRSNSVECSSRPSLPDQDEELPSLPGCVNEISKPCHPHLNNNLGRKAELDKLAIVIACGVQSKLQKCRLSRFTSVRPHPVYEHLRDAFLEVDVDCDGKLTQAETIAFCQHFDLSSETASQFFTLLDGHQTGFANWESFLAMYALLYKGKPGVERYKAF